MLQCINYTSHEGTTIFYPPPIFCASSRFILIPNFPVFDIFIFVIRQIRLLSS